MNLNADKPQIVEHASKNLNYTVFSVKWIPRSARLVALGSHARGTGALEIYSLEKGQLSLQVFLISECLLVFKFFYL